MLPKLEQLSLEKSLIADKGCAALASALESGAMPELKQLNLLDPNYHLLGPEYGLYDGANPASVAAIEAVYAARLELTDTEGCSYP